MERIKSLSGRALTAVVAALLSMGPLFGQSREACRAWRDFEHAQRKGLAGLLPDFSYAGYRHGETEAPTVDYKVFNVCDFGAVPNDHVSDREAVIRAIRAAEKNGSGVVFFPKGRYLLHPQGAPNEAIEIRGSRIVLRGEGAGPGGSEICMEAPLHSPNELEKWMSPSLFRFNGRAYAEKRTGILSESPKGTFRVRVEDASALRAGDWICLRLSDNSPQVIARELAPYRIEPDWSSLLINGVQVYDYHQIERIRGNEIELKEPVMRGIDPAENWYVQAYPHIEEVGVEDLAFVGNWKETFIHHKDDLHDGGWKFVEFRNVVHSWLRRCRFTDMSEAVSVRNSANVSVYDCTITGNRGHNAVHADASSRVFIGAIDDQPSQWHACGVCKHTMGTVLWRIRTRANSCFESHASQPRATLFDCCEGGFMRGHGGGAIQNNPNHLADLVLWNYRELDEGSRDFDFWPSDTPYFRFLPPVVVGFHGAGTTFRAASLAYEESTGEPVDPESLFEAQLRLRLGRLPQWLETLREQVLAGRYSGEMPELRTVEVAGTEALEQAVREARPGDRILLEDGVYRDVKLIVEQSGWFDRPLLVEARHPGEVTFSGDVRVELRGDHVALRGIRFTDGARNPQEWQSHGPGLVAIYGDYCEVADCLFFDFDEANSAYITTSLDEAGRVPRYASIHHCAFIEKRTLDQVINLNNTPCKSDEGESGVPMYHRVSYCYFSNPPKKGNAGGGIRIGYWRKDYGRCLIDNNLFERQDSEAEIITSKSMENVFYNNTFLNCRGTLNFRHGDRQVAINNFFIGTDTMYGYGGMYVWGSDHIIACNFFKLPSTIEARGNSAVYFNCGPVASEHALAYDILFAKNTLIDTGGTDLNFASLYDRRVEAFGRENVGSPHGIRFIGNRFFSETGKRQPILHDPNRVAGTNIWIGNLYNGMETGCESPVEGLSLSTRPAPRYDDSKVYLEEDEELDFSLIEPHLPFTRIEGIDLDFRKLIDRGCLLSPLTRREVGPRWCRSLPGSYADTGRFDRPTARSDK